VSDPAPPTRPSSPRRRIGLVLVVAGLLTIVVSVLVVLETANGPGTGPKSFAERRSYDQVKVAVHASYPLALLAGLGGLALAMTGARLLHAEDPGSLGPG
jgi:hypothetical protein